MELAARTGAWKPSGAPLPYLRRVAHLESHGTEWIDTGLVANGNLSYEIQLENSGTQFNNSNSFGSVLYSPRCRHHVTFDDLSHGITLWIGNGDGCMYYTHLFNERVFLKFDSAQRMITCNELKFNNIDVEFSTVENFYLFARSGIFQSCSIKIYDASFYQEDKELKLIPVLDLLGRPAMYDEVSGKLFYNQGTGEFTWGELDAVSALDSSRGGGGTKCLTPRRSYRRSLRPSARFCAHSHRWEVAA